VVGPGGLEPPTYGSLPGGLFYHPAYAVFRPVADWSLGSADPPLYLAELRAHQRSSINGRRYWSFIRLHNVGGVRE
jgi:hypothetical protein